MSYAFKANCIKWSLLQQGAHSVGDLNLADGPRRRVLDFSKNVRGQNVAADDCQIRRRLREGWFLNHVLDLVNAVTDFVDVKHAKARDGLPGNLHSADNRRLIFFVNFDQLFQRRYFSIDDVIAEHDGERLVADKIASLQNGMTQPQRFTLAHVTYCGQVRNVAYGLQVFGLAAIAQQ